MVPSSQASDEFFSTLSIFRDLTPSQINTVRSVLYPKSVSADYTLMTEEQPGELVYIIAEGSVKICVEDNGDNVVIALRGPGELIGEMSVLDGMGRSATVITQEPSVLFWCSHTDFWNVLWDMPPIPYNMSRLLTQRLRVLTSQFRAMTSLDVQGRLAHQLVTLSEEYGHPHPETDGIIIPFQLKQSELAGMIGSTREQVNRLLGSWTRRGLISRQGTHLIIRQSAALKKLCKSSPPRTNRPSSSS